MLGLLKVKCTRKLLIQDGKQHLANKSHGKNGFSVAARSAAPPFVNIMATSFLFIPNIINFFGHQEICSKLFYTH